MGGSLAQHSEEPLPKTGYEQTRRHCPESVGGKAFQAVRLKEPHGMDLSAELPIGNALPTHTFGEALTVC